MTTIQCVKPDRDLVMKVLDLQGADGVVLHVSLEVGDTTGKIIVGQKGRFDPEDFRKYLNVSGLPTKDVGQNEFGNNTTTSGHTIIEFYQHE